jgi:hypothetical protein
VRGRHHQDGIDDNGNDDDGVENRVLHKFPEGLRTKVDLLLRLGHRVVVGSRAVDTHRAREGAGATDGAGLRGARARGARGPFRRLSRGSMRKSNRETTVIMRLANYEGVDCTRTSTSGEGVCPRPGGGTMSDYVVPLTSPVQLTNLNDIHAVDLHVRYCELVKAYEQLVFPRPSLGARRDCTGRAAEAMDDNATNPQLPGPVCQLLRACGGALTPLPSLCAGAGP